MKNYFPNLLITGAEGQLGFALREHPRAHAFRLHAFSRSQLDITDFAALENAITQFKPQVMINAAAYTRVDDAEKDRENATAVNTQGAAHLAKLCQQYQLPLIHISTDYIFDGESRVSYQENDVANPLNHYGMSKWLGELAIRERCKQFVILRVSGIFSEHATNFVKTILRLAKTKNELTVVCDQITCPTYAAEIANAIFTIAENFLNGAVQHPVYHFCGTPAVSWYDFANVIVSTAKLPVKIHAVTTDAYQAQALRPRFSALNCDAIYHDLQLAQPSWQNGLQHVINQLMKR